MVLDSANITGVRRSQIGIMKKQQMTSEVAIDNFLTESSYSVILIRRNMSATSSLMSYMGSSEMSFSRKTLKHRKIEFRIVATFANKYVRKTL